MLSVLLGWKRRVLAPGEMETLSLPASALSSLDLQQMLTLELEDA